MHLNIQSQNEIPFIRVKVIEITNDNVTIAITDNGIGIEQEYLDKIFVIFQRLENDIHIKGTGIGLAIVKKINRTF